MELDPPHPSPASAGPRADLVARVRRALRTGGAVSDAMFDAALPPDLRALSTVHWTPVSVARRAAELLVTGADTRVLDVGSGAGKFCIVGALTTEGTFVGVERKRTLARAAAELAKAYDASRVAYRAVDMERVDWTPFDAVYLYNPFYENLLPSDNPKSRDRFMRDVDTVERKLETLRAGARVVSYHGFGGVFPPTYDLLHREPHGSGRLELWVNRP